MSGWIEMCTLSARWRDAWMSGWMGGWAHTLLACLRGWVYGWVHAHEQALRGGASELSASHKTLAELDESRSSIALHTLPHS